MPFTQSNGSPSAQSPTEWGPTEWGDAATWGRPGRLPAATELELAVDLGHGIGSPRWWRGIALLFCLLTLALWLTFFATPTPALTPPLATQTSAVPMATATPVAPIAALDTSTLPSPPPALLDQALATSFTPLVIASLAQGGATGTTAPMSVEAKVLAAAPEPLSVHKNIVARKGETLTAALRRAGVGGSDRQRLADTVSPLTRNAPLPAGSQIDITLGRRFDKDQPRPLEMASWRARFDLHVDANRLGGDFIARAEALEVINAPARVEGAVGPSLYVTARRAGVPSVLVAQYIKALSYGVDFGRDVGEDDRFSMVFEREVAETGDVQTGRLLYASLNLSRRKDKKELIWYAPQGEKPQFFHPDGGTVQRMLMKTPVDGARLSSGFGWRRHPVLGYSRLHKGVDFAAAPGTPIMAAGDGVIEVAIRHRGYGNMVKIRHGNGYRTLYGHMLRFGKGITTGKRVAQGTIIGYVGSTGLSTGPHLHYEIHANGQPVNPRDAKLPTGRFLAGQELRRFKTHVARLHALPLNQSADQALAAAGVARRGEDQQG